MKEKKNYFSNISSFIKGRHCFFLKLAVSVCHYWFCYYHWSSSLGQLNDSYHFYNYAVNANSWLSVFGIGTPFISFLIYPLVKLGIPYGGLFFLFSTLSLLGYFNYINLFYKLKNRFNKFTLVIIAWFLFLPSIHYWTAFIGKEAVLFFLMSVLLKHILEKRPINRLTLPLLILVLFVRPYLFAILSILLICFYILNIPNKEERFKKIIVSAIVAFLSIPVLLKFLKIKDFSSIKENYFHLIEFANTRGNSSINLASSNYFDRLALVLFKPLPFNVKTFYQVVVSVENVINMICILLIIYLLLIINKKSKLIHFLSAVCLFVILFLAIYMYNLGLASRMRVMFIPYMLYLLFELHFKYFSNANNSRLKKE